jgi:K+-sensing histidine kinase KdpD
MEQDDFTRPWWLLPVGRVNPWWWVSAAAVFVAIDYVAAAGTQFPTLYLIPVVLAAWYSGAWPAIVLAVAVSALHVFVLIWGWQGNSLTVPIIMTIVRSVVVSVMALWFARLSEHERQLHRYVVKLEGLLPICSHCKSIKNEDGRWETLEAFISERSDADFSHGLCPNCQREHYTR